MDGLWEALGIKIFLLCILLLTQGKTEANLCHWRETDFKKGRGDELFFQFLFRPGMVLDSPDTPKLENLEKVKWACQGYYSYIYGEFEWMLDSFLRI